MVLMGHSVRIWDNSTARHDLMEVRDVIAGNMGFLAASTVFAITYKRAGLALVPRMLCIRSRHLFKTYQELQKAA